MTAKPLPLPCATNQFDELLAWIRCTTSAPLRMLEIGGGGSYYDFGLRLRGMSSLLVGVDPDSSVLEKSWFDAAYAETVEEYSERRLRGSGAGGRVTGAAGASATIEQPFDGAVCLYVLEHVEHPEKFLSSVRAVLAEGGACFGVTPNLYHYFGMASAITARLGIDEWLLRRLRPVELVEAYHSPVRYRMNSPRAIHHYARKAGFREVELRSLEQPGMFETYFPAALRHLPRAYSAVVNHLGAASFYGTLIFRLGT